MPAFLEVLMRHRPRLSVLIFTALMVLSLPAPAQQKPLTQEQVQGIVRSGLGDENGARAIEQRGIDFAPTESFLEALRSAGAGEIFIKALRAAKQPTNASPPPGPVTAANAPLDKFQVFELLTGEVPAERMATLIRQRGIAFEPDSRTLDEMRTLGAMPEVESALLDANVYSLDMAAYKKHVNLVVEDYSARLRETPRNLTLRVVLSRAYTYLGDKEAEVNLFREALRLDPTNADAHVYLGWALWRKNDYQGMLSECQEALRLDPKNENAHLLRGAYLGAMSDHDGAMAEYREALRANPRNLEARAKIGEILEVKRDWEGALAEFRENLRLFPNSLDARRAVAEALEGKGDLEGAIAEYEAILRLRPSDPRGHESLATALVKKGECERAIAEYREMLRLDPKYPVWLAHTLIARALAKKGDWNGAISEYREGLRLSPKNDFLHNELGTVLEHQGDVQGALAEYRAAYDLSPPFSPLKENYQRLSKKTRP